MDKVLEIGAYAAGYCGRLFTRTNAEVVRIVPASSPAWASDAAMDAYLHAGKKQIGTTDHALISSLANKADVVICEANTATALESYGFNDWQTPVKLAITPFGLTGPKRNWQATSSVLLAMGGYTNLIGDPDREPLTLPGHYVDFQTGALGFAATNACRLANQSDFIDISMLETVMSLSQFTTVRWHCAGEIRTRHGNDFHFVVPSNLFPCVDGWIYINIVPAFWDAFTVFVDLPELLIDERFTTNDLRMKNRDALHELTANVIVRHAKAELVARAEASRIPLGVVQTFEDVLADPHLAERNFWETVTVNEQPLISAGLPFQITGGAGTPSRRPSMGLSSILDTGSFT